MNLNVKKLEGLLFVRGAAISYREAAKLLELSIAELTTTVAELERELEGTGLTLVSTETEVALTTSPEITSLITQLTYDDASLSPAAAEVLAIIAYRGPINASDISVVRGVDSRRTVRLLLTSGLIKVEDISDVEEGQERYAVSAEFLQGMGVTTRENLPQFDSLSSDNRIDKTLEEHAS